MTRPVLTILGKAKGTRIPIPSALLILAMTLSPAMSRAGIIFSSFGPYIGQYGMFTCCAGNGIGYNGESAQIAAGFTPSTDQHLNTIDLAIYKWAPAGSGFTFNISLFSDAGGHPGSTPLETWMNQTAQDTPEPGLSDNYATLEYESFHTNWNGMLFAGQRYWLVASPIDTTTSVLWNGSSDLGADPVEFTSSDLGGVWSAPQNSNGVAFDVIGYTVLPPPAPSPEPASGLFIPTGMAAFFLLRKVRRAANLPAFSRRAN